jgi:copper chaperone CopZ
MIDLRTILSLAAVLLVMTTGLVHAEMQTGVFRVIGLSDSGRGDDFRQNMKAIAEVELVAFDADKASATLQYDPEKLIPPGPPKKPADRSPEKVRLKLNDLLHKASKGSFRLTVPTGIPEDKLTKVDIKVGLLDCKGCRYAVYIAVALLDGVERAIVNSETQNLTVWIDPAKVNREALEAALKREQVPLPGP